mmetsp:Transcript_133370/g.345166  ORF Transcript_133370/g.345166 Transcript_133370/m.345166 type:complete len:1163 (+) Transcript_133370:96-3584(+)
MAGLDEQMTTGQEGCGGPPHPGEEDEKHKKEEEEGQEEEEDEEVEDEDEDKDEDEESAVNVDVRAPAVIEHREKRRSGGSAPGPKIKVDFMDVRFTAPSESRRTFGEVRTSKMWDKSTLKPVEGGLFCTEAFGPGRAYSRRERLGLIPLAWPCSHIWLAGKRGPAKTLLNETPNMFFDKRMYIKDYYVGEWTAADVWRPRQRSDCPSIPQIPAVGSPVAASQKPVLKRLAANRAERVLQEGAPAASRLTETRATLLATSCRKHLSWEALRISDALRFALEGGATGSGRDAADKIEATVDLLQMGLQLPSIVVRIYTTMEAEDRVRGAKRLRRRVPEIISSIVQSSSAEGPLTEEEACKALMTGIGEFELQGSGCKVAAMSPSARQDFERFWSALVVPHLEGDLAELMNEFEHSMLGQVEAREVARAVSALHNLQDRCLAALDIALQAYAGVADTATGGEEESAGENKNGSRFNQKPYEVVYYDTAMPAAAFHEDDLDRIRDRVAHKQAPMRLLPADVEWVDRCLAAFATAPHGASAEPSSSSTSPPQSSRRDAAAATGGASTGARQLTRPRRKANGSANSPRCREASYYQQTSEKANMRWHMPLQDSARPGRAGGAHQMPVGQDVPAKLIPDVLRHHAIRPRPAGTPHRFPADLEKDGCLFLTSGGAGFRHYTCLTDAAQQLRQLRDKDRRLDCMERIIKGLSLPHGLGLGRSKMVTLPNFAVDERNNLAERVRLVEAILSKRQCPEWMFFVDMPVLPPDLRTQSSSADAASDINALYSKVMLAGETLSGLILEGVSGRRLRRSKLALQSWMDNTIDNGKSTNVFGSKGRPVAGVAQRLKGKMGRMRLNMLGKRVDYSARSVIVVDPSLRLDECALPATLARDLFEPFVVHEVRKENDRIKSRQAAMSFFKHDLSKKRQMILLQKAMKDRFILLNRAPTLHRLSIQAFRPKLTDGQAIKIHPLVCAPFNADFDGDTMTVHLALGQEAQEELQTLMTPTANLSSPATGDPVIGPTQDMVLGIYYLTGSPPDETKEPLECDSLKKLIAAAEACYAGEISHDWPLAVHSDVAQKAAPMALEADSMLRIGWTDKYLTTAGRVLFFLFTHRGASLFERRPEVRLLQDLDDVPLDELGASASADDSLPGAGAVPVRRSQQAAVAPIGV